MSGIQVRTITALACAIGAALLGAFTALPPAAASVTPNKPLWASRYSGTGDLDDVARAMAASPDGQTVYVTGTVVNSSERSLVGTVAYNASTGTQEWAQTYGGTANGATGLAIALSPDGSTVYVTGGADDDSAGEDYTTVAYDAASGTQVWVATYNGPANLGDQAESVAVSPDGHSVYVTGQSYMSRGTVQHPDYATVAYNATTGSQLWAARYNGPADGNDAAVQVAVSPSGGSVFVTGTSNRTGHIGGTDMVTIAYHAATGKRAWLGRYNGPANSGESAASLAVSPDGRTVVVTGASGNKRQTTDIATVAYNASTGAQRWVRRYGIPGAPASIAAGTHGRTYVTGEVRGVSGKADYVTIAYRTLTGGQVWVKHYNGPDNGIDLARAVTAAPGGGTIFVTGYSADSVSGSDYATIAYNSATGARLWVRRYNPGSAADAEAFAVVSSPDGHTVFVTGTARPAGGSEFDYTTVAYKN